MVFSDEDGEGHFVLPPKSVERTMATLPSAPTTTLPSNSSSNQTNHYVRRLASSPYKCLVCLRPTSIILVSNSIPTQDWFASCESHLSDRHFASRIQSSSIIKQESAGQERSLSDKVSKEEIQKVKKEWEQREKEKKEKKEKEKEEKKKEGDEKDKDKKEKEKEKSWLETITSPFSQEEVKPSGRGASSTSKANNESTNQSISNTNTGPKEHERYSLHRDFYQMRVEERKKKEALKRAAELKMPQAPKGALGGGI